MVLVIIHIKEKGLHSLVVDLTVQVTPVHKTAHLVLWGKEALEAIIIMTVALVEVLEEEEASMEVAVQVDYIQACGQVEEVHHTSQVTLAVLLRQLPFHQPS